MPPSWTGMLLAMTVVVLLFAVVATTFIPFGQLVGWYLEDAPNGVAAYSVNVLASLAGLPRILLGGLPAYLCLNQRRTLCLARSFCSLRRGPFWG